MKRNGKLLVKKKMIPPWIQCLIHIECDNNSFFLWLRLIWIKTFFLFISFFSLSILLILFELCVRMVFVSVAGKTAVRTVVVWMETRNSVIFQWENSYDLIHLVRGYQLYPFRISNHLFTVNCKNCTYLYSSKCNDIQICLNNRYMGKNSYACDAPENNR